MNKAVIARYEQAKALYESYGVDVDKALADIAKVRISLHCWQGDDIQGFLFKNEVTGGIQVTGNYPYKARTIDELRADIEEVLTLLPGKYSLSLHAIYADTNEKVDLNQLEEKHFASWVAFAKEKGIGLDFNPTCFAHPKAATGFTLSAKDEQIRKFWIEHCKRSRKIAAYFGKELGIPAVNNIWIPDGMKDTPYDRYTPRKRLETALDEVLQETYDSRYLIDAVESKVFGIGAESYTVGSNEFYLGYATKHQIALTLDAGHFHPTEMISDKISSVLLHVPHLLLHVSRPVRWDSDHVVILDDEVIEIARSLVRNQLLEKTSIGLDFFDASINRIAAWTIGTRSVIKAILKALLEPTAFLQKIEEDGNYTDRMLFTEEIKALPFGAIFDYYLESQGKKIGQAFIEEIHRYENEVLAKRG